MLNETGFTLDLTKEAAHSVFRVGLVKERDTQGARVRVTFPDQDQLISYWLPVVVFKTQDDKAYWMPDLGEQVVCLMDERDEAGAVLGAIYSVVDTPPVHSADKCHFSFKDGATFEYDRSTHAFAIHLPEGSTMNIGLNGASVTIDSAGNVAIIPGAGAKLELGQAGATAGVARLGDSVQVIDDEGGSVLRGTITSASKDVVAN